MAETAEAGDAMHHSVANAGCRQKMFNGIDRADGNLCHVGGERVEFLPEADGFAQNSQCNQTQPLMLFAEDEGASLVAHAFAITVEQGAANIFALERKVAGLNGEVGTDRESDEIDGVGRGPGFVKVVDAPDKAAFDVTPGAEILDVKIADGEDARSLGNPRTDLWPELGPAIVGGAKEGKKLRLHAGMFKAEIGGVYVSALAQPVFKVPGSFDNVHAGNDSEGRIAKSNDRNTFSTTKTQRHGENQEVRKNALFCVFPCFRVEKNRRQGTASIESEVRAGT